MLYQSISAGRFHGTCCMQMTWHWRNKLRRGCKTVLVTGKGHWSARDLIKVNINKTEIMVCSKDPERVTIKDAAGNTLKQTETFKYLGSTFSAQGGCKQDVRNRIRNGES